MPVSFLSAVDCADAIIARVGKQLRVATPLAAGKPVMFHSDGNINDLVPMLLDAGVDCVHPLDPYGVDYREFKKKYGGLVCLAGNIDIEFPLAHGTPEEVREDVRSWMEAHEYESVEQMKGSMSQASAPDPAAFERANYMESLVTYSSPIV